MESIPDIKTPILVVDDDEGLLLSIKATLVSSGMPDPALVSDGRRVMGLVRKHRFHLVLLDLIMPHLSGMEILQELKEEFPAIECVMVTAIEDVSSAVKAMRFGAYDYMVKPVSSEKLFIVINRALERYDLRHELALFQKSQTFSDLKNPAVFEGMVAKDEAMALVFHQAEAVAPTHYNVLITGESGTGKEMLARIVHTLSSRSKGPFVAVNVGAFSKTLLEDDLFGHSRGAYTGALTDKKGFFESAKGGTLFLDEITELEPALQGKLLRVIQERMLYRLGSTEARNVDVRIITATNRDIDEEVRKERFRGDVFYRLNTCHIHIPPLRERKKDILPLARHFLKIHATRNQKEIDSLAPDLANFLLNYPFPGNVRELENIIASAVLWEKESVLTLSSASDLASLSGSALTQNEKLLTLAKVEEQHVKRILDLTGGNRTQTAKILGIGLRTLQRKLKLFEKPV
jgi:DNA-binding NtrC family response regulator